jgi:type II secretory pathway component HofQ
VAKLSAELAERRRLAEEQRLNRPLRTVRYRLSYARAAELAPLIKKFLSPRGDVVYDARTNTLYITEVE